MTSVVRPAAVILLLVAVAAAAPFAPGTRFGMVGLDYRFPSGGLYTDSHDSDFVRIDPLFRAGIAVLPSLTVGAEVALFHTFPDSLDAFTSTPVFSFGPAVTYFLFPDPDVVQPYLVAGGGANYALTPGRLGWRTRLAAGVAMVPDLPVAFELEGGWYGDWSEALRWNPRIDGYEFTWLRGNTGFIGFRVMGFRQ